MIVIKIKEGIAVDSLQDIQEFVNRNFGTLEITEELGYYEQNCKDMISGWKYINNVKDYSWTNDNGPFEPGVYALVYDPVDSAVNPILDKNTIIFGESTRDCYKRIICHTGALKGTTTNMTDKWNKHLPKINRTFGIDIRQDLTKIKIFFRPHDYDDGAWRTERVHSVWMETSCQAIYKLIHGKFTPGNTRDLPSDWTVKRYRQFLIEEGLVTTNDPVDNFTKYAYNSGHREIIN